MHCICSFFLSAFQGVKAVKQEFDDVALARARLYKPPGMF